MADRTTDTCKHIHGGTVPNLPGWVCGQCWRNIEERPKRYGMVSVTSVKGSDEPAYRQEIIWMAEERRAESGLTLGEFLVALAQRFAVRSHMERSSAMDLALSTMQSLSEVGAIGEFADPVSDWSREVANDIADEEMSYWDNDEGEEANG